MSLTLRHSNLLGLAILLSTASSAPATEVNVVGLFSGKAMVSINGGKHRVIAAGETSPEGVKLITADSSTAVLEIDGKRQNLGMGKSATIPSADGGGNQSAVLAADIQGHFVTTGSINGTSARMMVDTGATMVSMGKDEARRLGISYLNGEHGMVSTANGVVPAYRVTLNTVRVGNLVLNQVDGLVQEASMPYVLLGMSFLKRLEIKQDGTNMMLLKKY
ncbi:MAG: TIGR02281 family clan AA aspartic protease [Sulfuricella sp.]|nr:TIGR02281 family clan AA aspartic protease [Sulfuricella sp.]